MKVNFIIVGAMKCGTTSLSNLLAAHPKVSFSTPKEPQFFSRTNDWKQNIDLYHNYFEQAPGKLYGEASTNYSKRADRKEGIWEDIFQYNPDMKIIYLMRHPIERIISHYMHSYERGQIKTDLQSSILKRPYLLNVTKYYMQISPYIQQFGENQVLLVRFDEFVMNQQKVLKEVCNFLELDIAHFKRLQPSHSNASLKAVRIPKSLNFLHRNRYRLKKILPSPLYAFSRNLFGKIRGQKFKQKPQMSIQKQMEILKLLSSEIDGIESLTGWDLTTWRKPIKSLSDAPVDP